MGAWSTESFGNDTALDWFGELDETADPLLFIQETLTEGSTEDVIAASAVLAVLSGKNSVEDYPALVIWCAGKSAPPTWLKQAAADAIQAIIDDPEADVHDTWAENGEDDENYLAWLSNLRSIQNRLL